MKRSIGRLFAHGPLPLFTSLLAVSIALSVTGCPASLSTDPPEAWVEVAGKRIAVELADTPEKQQLGLGQRDALPWDTGMYFPYEHPAIYNFWMKGMRFSIDIIWIRNGRIIDVHAEVPFVEGENGPHPKAKGSGRCGSRGPCRIRTNAGLANRRSRRARTHLELKLIPHWAIGPSPSFS